MFESSSTKADLLAVLLFILVIIIAPHGRGLFHLTSQRLQEKVQGARNQVGVVSGFLDTAAPRLANFLANLVLAAGIMLLLLFLCIQALTPWSLYWLHRKAGALEKEVAALRQEMGAARQALDPGGARAPHRSVGAIWSGTPHHDAARSPTGSSPSAEN